MGKVDLKIDWATYEAAKYACLHWHYSHSVPAGKTVKFGVWEDGLFIGVIIFSRGTCGHIFNRFSIPITEGCELTRVALNKHKTQVSRIISIAIKLLKRKSPGMRIIVSFAAKSENHHGGIYQAGGWIYDGESQFKQEYMINGRRISDRTISGGVRAGRIRRADLVKIPTETKHRYFMPLDDEMRKRIEPLRKPYPKRPKQAMASDQEEQRRGSADPDAPKNEVKNDAQTSH